MIENKYQAAVNETASVLSEWMGLIADGQRVNSPHNRSVIATKVVERLIAKGIIQDTDPSELVKVY